AARLRLPLLVVAANRLGTVNHCALTAHVADTMGLVVAGFVLSNPAAEPDTSADTNAATIVALTGLSFLGELRHGSDPAAAAQDLDVPALLSWMSRAS